MRHSIIFGGIDSADFGIYIGGEGTFNAPERDVEMISIPGRDGAFALDKGRFENIEVKYTVINQEPDLATFSANLEGFRNALCSQRGYQRLEDTFHPDEYRMAVFADKFEVKPIEYNTAAEFDIVFDCKPQRYLTDGETAVSVDDGDTLTNPTLFESSPLLEAEGYGSIEFNGFRVNIDNAVMGNVVVADKSPMTVDYAPGGGFLLESENIPIEAYSNTGDGFTASINLVAGLRAIIFNLKSVTSVSITTQPTTGKATGTKSGANVNISVEGLSLSGQVGTDATASYSCACSITYKTNLGETETTTVTLTFDVGYSASTGVISCTVTGTTGGFFLGGLPDPKNVSLTVNSTVSILGHPTYIDCDLGEAYKIVDGVLVSLNRYIDLGSKLPTLAAGSNEITYDNTITDLQIVPRWWRV